jgi:alpha-amylase/alpha-mannosidase (GH57 family)
MTRVAILWHMHQPYYEDLVTREHILPWVRLHALKDYFGMAALLREFPSVRVTFNLVPSLLVQLEAFAGSRAHDRYLDLGLKPASELTDDEVRFIVANFFHAQRQRMIDVHPRYAQLLALREQAATGRDRRSIARRFSPDDLRDLQVWQKLAWLDPWYLENDARARSLVGKGQAFTEEDKALLRAIELDILNAVIPEYREAAARGQIEISTSPFYHPILPLLCDTDIYKRTHPQSAMPRHRFMRPEDAEDQLLRATQCHERLFGRRPTGLWPSEGSVSDDMSPLAVRQGFDWMATDELILARTLGVSFKRDGAGHVDQPERLYRPYVVSVAGTRIACVFRDHVLSDLIGFTYAGWSADAAAEDFVSRLAEAGRRYAARTGGEEALIPIILDGENAWEHFEGGGRPFLRALYRRLASHHELRTVTMSEGCETARDELTSIFPGSWIDANFYIWIGHPDDHRAWSELADARDALDRADGAEPAALARAREEILIAEGSDWFWWYGDDHSSEHDAEFDDLFRRHLRNVYRLLQKPVPEELFATNISSAGTAPAATDPTGLVSPTLDGEETSYFEWLGAGCVELRDQAGAMHQAERREWLLTAVWFGFSHDSLFLRLDGVRPVRDLLDAGFEIAVSFLKPEGVRLLVGRGAVAGALGETAAVGTILELAIPLTRLRARDGVSFFVTVRDPRGVELERHPAGHPVEVRAFDASFEARNWTA